MKTFVLYSLLLLSMPFSIQAQPVSLEDYTRFLSDLTGQNPSVLPITDRQTVENKRLVRQYFIKSFLEMGFSKQAAQERPFTLTDVEQRYVSNSYNGKYRDYPVGESVNFVAEIPGTDLRDEVIVIGAHYDSVPGTTGANDNGTGTAAVLSAAAAIKGSGLQPRRTIRFVLFDLEEVGTRGSYAYFKRALLQYEKIALAVNLDMVGYMPPGADRRLAYDAGPFQNTIGPYIESIAQKTQSPILLDSSLYHGFFPKPEATVWPRVYWELAKAGHYRISPSDGLSGYTMGFPTVGLIENATGWTDHFEQDDLSGMMARFYPFYHTPKDTMDRVNLEFARDITQLATAVVVAAANENGNPWDRRMARLYREQLRRHFSSGDNCAAALVE
jgi:Zn-dependent M28 family amino/carboxypeptidase